MGSVARVAMMGALAAAAGGAAAVGTTGYLRSQAVQPPQVVAPAPDLEDLALRVFDNKGRQIAIGSINRDAGEVEVHLREGRLRNRVDTTPGEVGIRR